MENYNDKHIELLSSLWHRIIKLSQDIRLKNTYEVLQELSTIEVGVINIIAQQPDVIFKDICEALGLPKSTLTNIIDRLEKRGLVERAISQKDRRAYSLRLTGKGWQAQQEHIDFEQLVLEKIIDALDTEVEKKMLLELADKVVIKLAKQF